MDQNLEFEREKWHVDVELRQRELALKEREQANRDADIEIRRKEQVTSKWRSPLVVAVFATAAAALGNAGVALVNGALQRDLESKKRDADLRIEESKAESSRILEMIKTGNTEAAAKNLTFLLDTALVADPKRAAKLREYLDIHGAPVLPSASSRVTFESSDAFTKPIQDRLQKNIDEFSNYLTKIGFPANPNRVKITLNQWSPTNTTYSASTNELGIGEAILDDLSSALITYSHHILLNVQGLFENAIEHGLADYFAASFLNNPKIGEVLAKATKSSKPYVRHLVNERAFSELRDVRRENIPYEGAEIWGGAFWEMRDRVGQATMDSILAQAWMSRKWSADPSNYPASFLAELLTISTSKTSSDKQAAIKAVLLKRKFPVQR